jgi:hypothetical protein
MAPGRPFGVYPGRDSRQDFAPEKRIADLERRLAEPRVDGSEAEISRSRRVAARVVVRTLGVLALLGLALSYAGFVRLAGVGSPLNAVLIWIGLALLGGSVVLIVPIRRKITKDRWQEGTVTFRTVEPGSVGETGQHVDCDVELNPSGRMTRVKTTVGPLDTERLIVGETMRCLIDRYEFMVLRAFPYAQPDASLPSGRELKFSKASLR